MRIDFIISTLLSTLTAKDYFPRLLVLGSHEMRCNPPQMSPASVHSKYTSQIKFCSPEIRPISLLRFAAKGNVSSCRYQHFARRYRDPSSSILRIPCMRQRNGLHVILSASSRCRFAGELPAFIKILDCSSLRSPLYRQFQRCVSVIDSHTHCVGGTLLRTISCARPFQSFYSRSVCNFVRLRVAAAMRNSAALVTSAHLSAVLYPPCPARRTQKGKYIPAHPSARLSLCAEPRFSLGAAQCHTPDGPALFIVDGL